VLRSVVLLAILWPSSALAGPWTRELWSYYAKVGADFYSATGYVDPETGERKGGEYFGQQYGAYGEVGVSPGWPVQVSLLIPVSMGTATFRDEFRFGNSEGHATTTRLGDGRLAVQTSILRAPAPLAIGAELKLPLYSNGDVGEEFGQEYVVHFPFPGDGQIDLTGWLLSGSSVPGAPMWFEWGIGYRHRTEEFIGWNPDATLVDSVVYRALVGGALGPVLLMGLLDGNANLEKDRFSREALSAGPTILWTFWRGLALEGRLAWELEARNQSKGFGFGFGLSYRDPA